MPMHPLLSPHTHMHSYAASNVCWDPYKQTSQDSTIGMVWVNPCPPLALILVQLVFDFTLTTEHKMNQIKFQIYNVELHDNFPSDLVDAFILAFICSLSLSLSLSHTHTHAQTHAHTRTHC